MQTSNATLRLTVSRVVCGKGSGVGVRVAASVRLLSTAAALRTRAAGEDLVNAAIFRLHVFDFHDVLQAVDGASKVDLPHGGITVLSELPRVLCPLPEERCVPLAVVASLFCVYPRNAEDGLFVINPLQSDEAAAVDHPDDPVAHPFWSLRDCFEVGRAVSLAVRASTASSVDGRAIW